MTEFDVSTLHAEDVLREEGLQYYEQGKSFFYQELVHLNLNILILDNVLNFPFHLFQGTEGSLFFRKVFENFYYVSILIITRISSDQGDNFFTIPRFKNRIWKFILHEYQDEYRTQFKRARFDKEACALIRKARQLRIERVAHVTEEIALKASDETWVTFGEIKLLYEKLLTILQNLLFNEILHMFPFQYQTDSKPDIEIIFDSIVQRSALLNMAENDPTGWQYRKASMTARDIEILNSYRSKFNLPIV
jgi:hypothetical protein